MRPSPSQSPATGARRRVVPSGRPPGVGTVAGSTDLPSSSTSARVVSACGRRPPSRGRRRPSRRPPAACRCATRCRAAVGRTARPVHHDHEGGVRLLVEADRVAAVAVEVAGDGPHVQAARGAEGDRGHGHALVVEQVEGGVGALVQADGVGRRRPSRRPAAARRGRRPANVTGARSAPVSERRPQPAVPGSYQATPSAPPSTRPWPQRCR